MQIFLGVMINIIVLAVVLPLFYVFIVSKARERLEREAIKKVEDELTALVHEFNRSAISNVALLEDAILRVRNEYADIIDKESKRGSKAFSNDRLKKEVENDINTTKREMEDKAGAEFDKIERETKQINNSIKFKPTNNENSSIKKSSLNVLVDDNTETINNNSHTIDSGAMNKADIDIALKKIKQNISINQEKKLRNYDNTIENVNNTSNKKNNKQETKTVEVELDKNEIIVALYKKGLSRDNIAKETNLSIAEVELVLNMEIRDN